MGIALPDSEPGGRSKLASATFTFIGLAFFFGVGLAGGAAYKIYFGEDGSPRVADQANPPTATPAAEPPLEQAVAATTPSAPETAAEEAAPDRPRLEASAPPAPAPQVAPPDASEPAMMAQAAPPAMPPTPEPAAQTTSGETPAAPALAQAAPESPAATAPPDAQAAMQAAEPAPVAALPQKPATAAKARRPAPAKTMAPSPAATHRPVAAPSDTAGHFRVQFGAFANEDNARRMEWAIEATGLKVEVGRDRGASGNPLFIVRSPSYPDRAAALSAAQAVQSRAKHLVNPVAIDYTIIPDRAAGEQHAQR